MKITDIKCGLFSKHLFQRRHQHGGFTKPLSNDKCVYKLHGAKMRSSKKIVSMMYTLGKDFFAGATFKGLWDVSFQTE